MTPFQKRVYGVVSSIPRGRIASYGTVAALMGRPRAARGVGSALCSLEHDTEVPWWRVVNRAGRISTTCLDHTAQLQRALLEAEGVEFDEDDAVSWERFGWDAAVEVLAEVD